MESFIFYVVPKEPHPYEKLLLGAIILVVGAVANYILEEYKSNEVERHYRLSQQYKAALEVYDTVGKLTSHYSRYCKVSQDDGEFTKNHQDLLDQFVVMVNTKSFLFSVEFGDTNQLIVHSHRGLIITEPDSRCNYHEFIIFTSNFFITVHIFLAKW